MWHCTVVPRVLVNLFLFCLCSSLRLGDDSSIAYNKETKHWLHSKASRRELIAAGNDLRGISGMDFDLDNNLILTHVVNHQVRKVDPETGTTLEIISDVGILPDDIVVAPDDTWFWTDLGGGTVYQRSPAGQVEALYKKFSYPFPDPITISDDGKYLYFAQCFNAIGKSAFYRRDLASGETIQIGGDYFLCASGGMNYYNGSLYASNILPQPNIFKLDLEDPMTPVVSEVTRAVGFPTYVDFDSNGNMYVNDFFSGSIYRVDYENDDVENNIELFATAPSVVDTMTIDKDDRLYVASAFSVYVYELFNKTESRVVYPPLKK